MQFSVATTIIALAASAAAFPAGIFPRQSNLTTTDTAVCGNATYSETEYKCWNTNLLCPILNGTTTFPCGSDPTSFNCYLPSQYFCENATLLQVSPTVTALTTATGAARL